MAHSFLRSPTGGAEHGLNEPANCPVVVEVRGDEPIPIETVEEGVLQGYSRVLNLLIRRDHGQLGWHDPETGQHIATFAQEQTRADTEREARMAAEAGARDLEVEMERHQRG